MQIRIGKRRDDKATMLVVPSRRSGLAPVMVQGVRKAKVREAARALIHAVQEVGPLPSGQSLPADG